MRSACAAGRLGRPPVVSSTPVPSTPRPRRRWLSRPGSSPQRAPNWPAPEPASRASRTATPTASTGRSPTSTGTSRRCETACGRPRRARSPAKPTATGRPARRRRQNAGWASSWPGSRGLRPTWHAAARDAGVDWHADDNEPEGFPVRLTARVTTRRDAVREVGQALDARDRAEHALTLARRRVAEAEEGFGRAQERLAAAEATVAAARDQLTDALGLWDARFRSELASLGVEGALPAVLDAVGGDEPGAPVVRPGRAVRSGAPAAAHRRRAAGAPRARAGRTARRGAGPARAHRSRARRRACPASAPAGRPHRAGGRPAVAPRAFRGHGRGRRAGAGRGGAGRGRAAGCMGQLGTGGRRRR